jgi:hypothetical protein
VHPRSSCLGSFSRSGLQLTKPNRGERRRDVHAAFLLSALASVSDVTDEASQVTRLVTGSEQGDAPSWWPGGAVWAWSRAPWFAAGTVLVLAMIGVLWIRHRKNAQRDPAARAFELLCSALGVRGNARLAVQRRARELGVAPVGVLIADQLGSA